MQARRQPPHPSSHFLPHTPAAPPASGTQARTWDKPDPAAARSSGKTPVRSSCCSSVAGARSTAWSGEQGAPRCTPTTAGNTAGLVFGKAGRARQVASLKHAPTGAWRDTGGGDHPRALQPGASPGPSLTPGASGKTRQAPPPASSSPGRSSRKSHGYYLRANRCSLQTRCSSLKGGAGSGDTPTP